MNWQPYEWQKQRRLRWITVAAFIFLILAMWWAFRATTEEYASFMRPDGHYRVVVIRKKQWTALMPGQTSDAPGVVQLYNQHGDLLHKTNIKMVQLVDHVDWNEKKLSIKLVAEWDLPD